MSYDDFQLTEGQESILAGDHSQVWENLRDRGSSGLSVDDYDLLTTIDKAPAGDQFAFLEDSEDGPRVAMMFCRLLFLLKTTDKVDALRYVSLWMRVLLSARPSLGERFFQTKQNPVKPCVDILYRVGEKYQHEIRGNIAVACSIMVGCDVNVSNENMEVKKFGRCLNDHLLAICRKEDNDDFYVESIATALKNSLKCPLMLEHICNPESDKWQNFAETMNRFILTQSSFQVLYLLGFSLLLVALKTESVQRTQMAAHANLCKTMINIVGTARKEKVRRIYLQVLECLAEVQDFAELCVMYGLYPTLERLTEENFKDDDIPKILESLKQTLKPQVRVMSSLERYEKELRTKTLELGPVHSEDFWKKNYMKFDKNDFQLVKDLTALLDSEDSKTVRVAAFDIGEFARLYPDGRRIVSKFGAKTKLFDILQRKESEEEGLEDLRKQVLLATQKILVVSWQNID